MVWSSVWMIVHCFSNETFAFLARFLSPPSTLNETNTKDAFWYQSNFGLIFGLTCYGWGACFCAAAGAPPWMKAYSLRSPTKFFFCISISTLAYNTLLLYSNSTNSVLSTNVCSFAQTLEHSLMQTCALFASLFMRKAFAITCIVIQSW